MVKQYEKPDHLTKHWGHEKIKDILISIKKEKIQEDMLLYRYGSQGREHELGHIEN